MLMVWLRGFRKGGACAGPYQLGLRHRSGSVWSKGSSGTRPDRGAVRSDDTEGHNDFRPSGTPVRYSRPDDGYAGSVAYDEGLAERVRDLFDGAPDVAEKKMFGGVAFMVAGNMACGIIGDDLLVRVARHDYDSTLALPFARQMDMTGRPMRGFVVVDAEGLAEDAELEEWVDRGVDFVQTLPPK